MKRTNILLVLIVLFAAFFCVATGVASALSDKYVGNTVVDLEWSECGGSFSKYKLYRDDIRIHTETTRNNTFYRDKGRSKGVTYDYKIEVYNATGGLVYEDSRSVTTGDVHGIITQSTTWTAASSPYTLTGGVSTAEKATLTIQSGVTVNSDIYSTRGTIDSLDSVTFNGAGIYLENLNGCSIKNCVFNGGRGSIGIALRGCNNCIIRNNVVENYEWGSSGINIVESSHNTLTSNTVNNNSGTGISLSSSNNNTLAGNTANNNGDTGISIFSSNNNTLASNTANNNGRTGIALSSSNSNTLTSNTANNNGRTGIALSSSNNNTLTGNTASDNNYKYGISLSSSNNNTLSSNTANNNYEYGISLADSSNSTLTGNTASDNRLCGIYVDHLSNCNTLTSNTASDNYRGIKLYGRSCYNNTLIGNTANNNLYEGICVSSSNNILTSNTATYNGYGISLYSSNNTLSGNTVNNNTRAGIYLRESDYNTFTSNIVNNNDDDGIYLEKSDHNTFTSNTVNYNDHYGSYGIYLKSSYNNMFTSNTVNYNGHDGIALWGWSCNNAFTSNIVNNNGGDGIFLIDSNNNTLSTNTANDNSGCGIYLSFSSDNTLSGNTANNNNRYGICLSAAYNTTYTNNNTLTGNTANNNSGDGIHLYCLSDNTLSGNTANDNSGCGIYLRSSDNSTLSDNTANNNHVSGIWLDSGCHSNTIENNVLVRDTTKGDSWSIYVHNRAKTDNIFKENTVGCNYPTKISIHENYHEGFKIRGVENPPEPPKPPEYLTKRQSISKYVEMENLSAETTLFLDFHYEDKDVKDIDEETLKVWKHNGIAWDVGRCADAWNGTRKLDTANNIVGVEVKRFCVFAPLAGLPVHNINTEEDFYTIQEAIDDVDTEYGHTITVDLSYTEAGTKENICVDKELTIKANYYGCYDTIIEAADSGKHVIDVVADEVAIQGFVIKGATGEGKAGVYIHSSTTDYTISQSIITDNNLGILCDIEDTHALVLENVKVWNNEKDGVRLLGGDLVIKGTDNEIINNGGNGTCVSAEGNVTIEGATEIHDNGGWGIHVTGGNVDIHNGAMSSINKNGKGGIRTNGLKLPANFVVDDNGGHGIDAAGGVVGGALTDTLILESVKVRNNKGDGIVVEDATLVIKGTDNEIINNGGNGTFAENGNITIEGTTEIHDNGGWGIYTDGGHVDVHDGSMSSINRNGKGGILTLGGLKLPANFVVDDNGGPGIVGGGGIVGGVVTDTLILESVKVRNNKDDGIGVVDAHLVIKGTGNEITNNDGNGTRVFAFYSGGNVTIEGTTEIHDNGGWGIYTDGGHVDVHDGSMSSINRNGKGGILTLGGLKLPANFVVDDNGGPGIVGGGGIVGGVVTDTLILESVKVRNNKDDGIGVVDAHLVIKGTGNEITNNDGNGTRVFAFYSGGNVTIEGTTEIHDNGGWGIYTDGGHVDVHDGSMSSINRNGKGGILTLGGLKLPANFVVDDNGGPGIVGGGGIVGGVVTDTLILESVKVRNNKDDGIGVVDAHLVIKGTGNEITNNDGNGTRVFAFYSGGNVTIEGTTEIHDNGGWGIYTDGGHVDVHDGSMSSINRNGKGGILTLGGLKLPANFVVDDNGGPGIVGGGGIVGGVVTDTLILKSVKVRNNKDDGIGVVDAHLVIKGTGNEITNNDGNGTRVFAFYSGGNVTIEGTTEIHDNGGWGIYTDGGHVDVHDGSVSSINRNGKGGILTLGGLKLPANFVVDDNGGPGIVGGGGIVGGVVTDTLILESVKVRNNKDDGIGVVDANLLIKGTGNEITNNDGNGASVWSGDVVIEGTTKIHDNGGWGIRVEEGKADIRDAEITNNAKGGIRLFSSEHGTITGNTVSNNGEYGIFLSASNDNTIYNNYFNNPKNAVDDGTNTWNIAKTAGTNIVGGPYLGGNYWSDYNGIDTNGDGLGDTLLPYTSNGGILEGGDYHPLVHTPSGIGLEKWVKYKAEPESEYRKAIDNATICDNVTFKIVIENKGGSIELTNVEVTDVLNCSLGYINGSAIPDTIYANNCPNNQTLNWTFSGLEPQEYINITFDARIVECGNDTNYAHVVAENGAGYTVVDNDTAWVNCTPPGTPVETATGTGTAHFATDAGTIEDLVAINESTLPAEGKPPLAFPHGFFSFNITGLTQGQTVVVTITLPDNVPVGTEYWKYHASEGGWIRIPMGSDDGDRVITITLVDGGLGDDDGTANGVIVDQGGPGIPGAPPVITSFAPPSPVNDTVCNWRRFNVTVNQTVNVSWYLNNTRQHTNVSTKEASYMLHAEVVGEHNVSAKAENANGMDMQTWIWNVTVAPLQVLEINKTDVPDPVSPGGTLNYTIRVNNAGNATATNVTVKETYDANVTFIAAEPAPSSGDDTWQFATLNASETRWINISVTVNAAVLNGTVLHNIVNVSCAEGVSDTDTENTTVFVAPALPPKVTSFAPPSPVSDVVCNWRTFNVTVDQTVNVSWYLNNTLQHTNVSTKEASYTLHAEVVGEHNVSAIASNGNGTDMQTWVWNILQPTDLPDLVIADKWEKGMTDRYKVFFVVENIGTATAPRGHYATLYVDGEEMEHKLVPKDLEPGESYRGRFRTRVELTGDSDTIKVCADNDNDVEESDEDNNCLENEWPCEVGKPDLEIEDKWEEWVGENLYIVHYVIHNNGTGIAPAGHHSTLIVDGEEVEHKPAPEDLAHCETYTDTFDTEIACTDGSDTIKVCADYFNDVEESDEDNNCLENEWPCHVKPDLEIEDKSEEWVGENLYIVHYVIHNKGTGIAPAGHHTTLIVDGEEMEHKPVPEELAHCETYTDTFDTEIACTDGSDTIKVCADSYDVVEESDEDNNCLENEWTCEVGNPDLVIADKYERGMSDRYKVFFVVENVGTVTALGGHYATLYVDGMEKENLLVRMDLKPGRSYSGIFRTRVTLTGDSDTIKVCADNDNDVDEADETNNCLENVWP